MEIAGMNHPNLWSGAESPRYGTGLTSKHGGGYTYPRSRGLDRETFLWNLPAFLRTFSTSPKNRQSLASLGKLPTILG